jgi:hypothetical protein
MQGHKKFDTHINQNPTRNRAQNIEENSKQHTKFSTKKWLLNQIVKSLENIYSKFPTRTMFSKSQTKFNECLESNQMMS